MKPVTASSIAVFSCSAWRSFKNRRCGYIAPQRVAIVEVRCTNEREDVRVYSVFAFEHRHKEQRGAEVINKVKCVPT
jgi:hypothetical protein